MTSYGGKLNPQIIKKINELCRDNQALREFLIYILYEESEHPGQWKWKDIYTKKLNECLRREGGKDED